LETSITYRRVWSIAWPIILGSVAQNLISVTDTAFLGRVGEIALGAAAIGGVYYLAMVMLAWGFGIGIQIIVARRYGEDALPAIGKTVQHGFLFLVPLAVVVFSIMKFSSAGLLGSILSSESVYEATLEYINVRVYGLFFVFINILFRGFYIGIARTRVITYTTSVLAIVNIFLDYCLIFGNFGFPEMGIAGAALASVIAEVSATLFFLLYTIFMLPHRKYHLFHIGRFTRELYVRIIRVSFPMMMQNFISLSSWLTFFLFVESMGERELAVSNIIRSFYVVLMIPMWGFASATNTLVSFLIGRQRADEVMGLVTKILWMCIAGVLVVVSLGMIFPGFVLSIYTNNPELIEAARPVLYVVSLAALMLSVAFIFFNGVSGTGKTQVSFIIEVIVLFFYLLFTYMLVYYWTDSITVVWTTEYLYAGIMGLLSFMYLKSGRWRGGQV
jgi:putative MATE family efflux protein